MVLPWIVAYRANPIVLVNHSESCTFGTIEKLVRQAKRFPRSLEIEQIMGYGGRLRLFQVLLRCKKSRQKEGKILKQTSRTECESV